MKIGRNILTFFLVIASLISLGQGVKNALYFSQDFQYSPAKIFLSGRNPYEVWLSGNPNGEIILAQAPNYLHHLYIFFSPIGLLDFSSAKLIWAISNVALSFAIVIALIYLFKLKGFTAIFFASLFFCSTPLRNNIGNGQHALFVMTFLIAPFLLHRGAHLLQGVGFAKYSFAPPFFVYSLLKGGFIQALTTLTIPILGIFFFWLVAGGGLIEAILAPLRVASGAVAYGTADFMSLIEMVTDYGIFVSGPLALGLSCMLVWVTVHRAEAARHLPIICIVSLITFKHLGYDFVFLAPAMAYALASHDKILRITTIVTVLWFWFGLKILYTASSMAGLGLQSGGGEIATLSVNFLALLFLALVFLRGKRAASHVSG